MSKDEALRLLLEEAKRKERHRNVPETRYWLEQYKLIATLAISATKATLEAKDEPVAFENWLSRNCPSGDAESVQRQWESSSDYADLYTTPPQRTWVGLTDEEVTWLCNTAKSHEQTWGMFVRAIEAKLKEKNT